MEITGKYTFLHFSYGTKMLVCFDAGEFSNNLSSNTVQIHQLVLYCLQWHYRC